MARPGHLRLISGTTIRGPYKRKHYLGTQRKEVEGLAYRDTYRTQCHEMWDFIGSAGTAGGGALSLSAPMVNTAAHADINDIPATGAATASFVIPANGFITAASFSSQSAFTQSGTNFFTITSNITRTSGTILSTTAHVNTTDSNAAALNGGVNLVANTNYALTLSSTATRFVQAGDVVTVTATVTGTITAVDGPQITLTLQTTTGRGVTEGLATRIIAAAGQPPVGIVTSTPNGEFLLQTDATSEAQTVALYWGDQLNFYKADVATPSLGDGPFFEARVKVGAVGAVGANDLVVIGVATAFNSTFSSIAEYAWFKLNGNMNLTIEGNDGTTVTTGQAPVAGTTALTAGTYYYFTIDFSDPTAVAFWFDDGVNDLFVGTVPMGALTTAMKFQPFIAVQQSTGTDTVDVTVDMLSVRWTRY
jgi:hypothetical protein